MSIYAFAEIKNGKVERIYASAKYPSKQRGNLFFDSEKVPDLRKSLDLPKYMNNFYSLVAFRPTHILVSRDVLGGKPLYYNTETLTFSSFKKYFDVECAEVKPGESLKIDYTGRILDRKIVQFEDVFVKERVDLSEAEEKIELALKSFKFKNACLAFSGGLDSSLLASFYDVELISVTANKKEEEWIKKSAESIGKKVKIHVFDENEVKDAVKAVASIIETDNKLQLSIAIPIYITLKFARDMGYKEVIFGQGADELFGGYKKYESLNEDELEKTLLCDVKNIGRSNLVRDTKLSYTLGVRILTPYLQWSIISVAINIPANYKIRRHNGEVTRKYFLREFAKKFIPKDIAYRDKKAIQYSTKTAKLLSKILNKTKN